MVSAHVFEVTAERFAADVVQQSMEVPICLDFWAEWCGPCRTLSPMLERLAEEHGGAFRLGMVDSEREQELAYAFQVKSIPFVVLMSHGKPVDGFTGALAERDLRAFLRRNGITPTSAAPAETEAAPDSAEARLGRAKQAAAAGLAAQARAALEGFPEDSDLVGEKARLEEGLALLEADLSERLPAAMALARARDALVQGKVQQAMDHVLESVAADRGYKNELARKAMLLCFVLQGEDSDASETYRRRLATLLY